jgi:hypothetical protein
VAVGSASDLRRTLVVATILGPDGQTGQEGKMSAAAGIVADLHLEAAGYSERKGRECY